MDIAARLKKARKYLKLSQLNVAKEYKTYQKTISDIENGKIVNIPNQYILYFYKKGISLEWIYTGAGSIIRAKKTSSDLEEGLTAFPLSESARAANPGQLFSRKTKLIGRGKEILLIPLSLQDGYLNFRHEKGFLRKLPACVMPGFEGPKVRMFEVGNGLMKPTLSKGDIVIGDHVEDLNQLKKQEVYVVVTKEELFISRMADQVHSLGNIGLTSDCDHPKTKFNLIPIQDILEIWHVRAYVSKEFPMPPSLSNRLGELENRLLKLEEKLK